MNIIKSQNRFQEYFVRLFYDCFQPNNINGKISLKYI